MKTKKEFDILPWILALSLALVLVIACQYAQLIKQERRYQTNQAGLVEMFVKLGVIEADKVDMAQAVIVEELAKTE